MSLPNVSRAGLYRWERIGLLLLGLGIVAFGAVVEIRSAFQKLRRTDFGVYARAAWAVRAGEDLYQIGDDRGWHYCYPPLFAVMLTPLADPPTDVSREGYLPFSVSVGIWYLLSVGCLAFAVDRMSRATQPDLEPGGRAWWYARMMPIYLCIGGIGFTLARGQVNVLLLALLAGMFLAVVRGQGFRAGVWLAGAITLKVIPALLVLWLMLVSGRRALVGMLAGLALFLGLIPAVVWGPATMLRLNQQLVSAVLQPGTTGSGDQTRSQELTNSTATDSQSFQAVIHNWKHLNPATRPALADANTRLAHWGLGVMLTVLVLGMGWKLRQQGRLAEPTDQLVLLGMFSLLMLHLSPVSHMHYYALGLPLVTGLWHRSLATRSGTILADWPTLLAVTGWGLATALPLLPGPIFDRQRELGLGLLASLGLLGFAMARLQASVLPGSVNAKTRPTLWNRVRLMVSVNR